MVYYNAPAEAVVSAIYDVQLSGDSLRFKEDQALYRDQPSDGGWKPVAFQAEHHLLMKNGKLHYEYNGECLGVDGATLKRGASGDAYPAFISVEK